MARISLSSFEKIIVPYFYPDPSLAAASESDRTSLGPGCQCLARLQHCQSCALAIMISPNLSQGLHQQSGGCIITCIYVQNMQNMHLCIFLHILAYSFCIFVHIRCISGAYFVHIICISVHIFCIFVAYLLHICCISIAYLLHIFA